MGAEKIISLIIENLLTLLPAEQVRKACDMGLDKIEELVEKSENKFDDAIVLPIIRKAIREPFGIEDNDEVQPEA